MVDLQDLLTRGYFPKELPPPFDTSSFANTITANLIFDSLPTSFFSPPAAEYAHYNLARAGTLRRRLALLNPILYFNLCREVEAQWPLINEELKTAPLGGLIEATSGRTGRAVVSSAVDKFTSLRAASRATARFLLKTDISRFYHSIYTHSIPWAAHGKPVAKADHSKALYGNVIDTLVRRCQDNQTLGLPIGADTSFILSEFVLAAAERKLLDKVKRLNGFRHVDDYELCFDTRSDAEQALAALQESLTEFELALNPSKTQIIELPIPLEKPWASELRGFRIGSSESDLVAFFDRAFVLSKQNPDESVLSYAIARTNGVVVDTEHWTLFQNLLCQCVLVEPNTVVHAIEQLLRYESAEEDYDINSDQIAEVMNKQIHYHAPLGHNSEVAWALWALINFNAKIYESTANVLSTLDDPIAALLSLDAKSRGLVPSLSVSKWLTYMTESDLYGRQWILSYEANVKGWLKSAKVPDHVDNDSRFSLLKKCDVSFYDPNKTHDFKPIATEEAYAGFSF